MRLRIAFRGVLWVAVMAGATTTPVSADETASVTLEVVVEGALPAKGTVEAAIYDSPDEFPDGRKVAGTSGKPDRSGKARLTFKDLAPGAYAVSLYHDENGNGAFDQGALGIPEEKFGFSNNADVDLGPPSFDEARIDIRRDLSITVDLTP